MSVPLAIRLDQPEEKIQAQSGYSSSTLWRWKNEGLPVRQRGVGKSARHFILAEDLKQFLIDTSIVVP